MRPVVTTLVLTMAAPILWILPGCVRKSEGKARHVLLVTVDTLRTDRLGCYGGPNLPSPRIDRLAGEGSLFLDAFAQRSMTLPSMTSFFTSRYPAEHGVIDNRKTIPDEEWLLAERLTGAGFHTYCLNAAPVLGPGRGNIEQGFEEGDYRVFRDEAAMTRAAVRYLEQRFAKEGQQEFLWIHFMNPHKPYEPPDPFAQNYTDPLYHGGFDGTWETLNQIYVDRIDLGREDRAHIENIYDGSVLFVDTCVGMILDALEQSGNSQDTLVVFSADHGEDLYSHNRYYFHANSVYGSSTRIPLIFRQGGLVQEQRVEGIVESLDIMPTILDWVGVSDTGDGDVKTEMRGEDLTGVLLGEETIRKAFSFAQVEVDAEHSSTGENEVIYSVRSKDWHYIYNPRNVWPSNPPHEGSYPMEEQELYDLRNDPDEQINVIDTNREVADRLYAVLQNWLENVHLRTLEDDLSDQRRQELEEAGYLAPVNENRRPPRENR